ncbi:uncharacterized protein ISCGN_007446 [Ixodes scapularis]
MEPARPGTSRDSACSASALSKPPVTIAGSQTFFYYLVHTKACDLQDVKAYRGLESFNYLQSGWVGNLSVHWIDEEFSFVRGQITPSQSVNQAFHTSWRVLLKLCCHPSSHCGSLGRIHKEPADTDNCKELMKNAKSKYDVRERSQKPSQHSLDEDEEYSFANSHHFETDNKNYYLAEKGPKGYYCQVQSQMFCTGTRGPPEGTRDPTEVLPKEPEILPRSSRRNPRSSRGPTEETRGLSEVLPKDLGFLRDDLGFLQEDLGSLRKNLPIMHRAVTPTATATPLKPETGA